MWLLWVMGRGVAPATLSLTRLEANSPVSEFRCSNSYCAPTDRNYMQNSANGLCIHQAALGPEVVGAAGQVHFRFAAEVALEDFTVVAYCFNHVGGPCVVKAEVLPVAAVGAEETLNDRILGLLHFCEIGLGYAAFFGLDQSVRNPIHDGGPLRIVKAISEGKRIFGNHVGQDFKVARH